MTKSAIMNISDFFFIFLHGIVNYLIKTDVFLLLVIIYVSQLIYKINSVVFDSDNLLWCTKLVKCIPRFQLYYRVLEN